MTVLYTREQARNLFLLKSAQSTQLRQALSIASARIRNMSQEMVSDSEKIENLGKLSDAISILSDPHHKNDLTVRVMFQYGRMNMVAIDVFARIERFSTLRKIADVTFEEIEKALSDLSLAVPLSLRTFYEVYHELNSERNLQSA